MKEQKEARNHCKMEEKLSEFSDAKVTQFRKYIPSIFSVFKVECGTLNK